MQRGERAEKARTAPPGQLTASRCVAAGSRAIAGYDLDEMAAANGAARVWVGVGGLLLLLQGRRGLHEAVVRAVLGHERRCHERCAS